MKQGASFQIVELAPAPRFSGGVGQPSLATIYTSHFDRMQAVVAAVRSGNALLMRLALEHHDRHGCSDEASE